MQMLLFALDKGTRQWLHRVRPSQGEPEKQDERFHSEEVTGHLGRREPQQLCHDLLHRFPTLADDPAPERRAVADEG